MFAVFGLIMAGIAVASVACLSAVAGYATVRETAGVFVDARENSSGEPTKEGVFMRSSRTLAGPLGNSRLESTYKSLAPWGFGGLIAAIGVGALFAPIVAVVAMGAFATAAVVAPAVALGVATFRAVKPVGTALAAQATNDPAMKKMDPKLAAHLPSNERRALVETRDAIDAMLKEPNVTVEPGVV